MKLLRRHDTAYQRKVLATTVWMLKKFSEPRVSLTDGSTEKVWKMAKVGHILQRGPHRVDWVCAGRAYDHLQKTVDKENIPHNGRLGIILRRP